MRDLERHHADPLRRGLALLGEAEGHAVAGRSEEALGTLQRALDDGCRYKREWLETGALAALRSAPRFAELVARADARYAADAAAARPRLTFAVPDALPDAFGYPLLVVLHGNDSNAGATMPHFAAQADAGWVVAVPQSSEIGATPDAFTWNDRERTALEVDAHLERLKRISQIDVSRIVLAGFSMGGLQALALALTRRIRVRGVVAVAPWLPDVNELAALVEAGPKVLRVFVVVGDDDPGRAGAEALVELLGRNGMRAQLDRRPGLGHAYPADMSDTVARAAAFVTAP